MIAVLGIIDKIRAVVAVKVAGKNSFVCLEIACVRVSTVNSRVAAQNIDTVDELERCRSPVELRDGNKPLVRPVDALSDAYFDRLFGGINIDKCLLKKCVCIGPA